jgi:hypothetical protein
MSIQARSLLTERTKLPGEIGKGPKQVTGEVSGSQGFNLSAPGYCPVSAIIRSEASHILVDCDSNILIIVLAVLI